VQPAGTGEAGVKAGFQQRLRVGERLFGVLEREELQETLGADPGPTGKQTLKMELAQMDLPRHVRQFGLLQVMSAQKRDGLLDAGVVAGPVGVEFWA